LVEQPSGNEAIWHAPATDRLIVAPLDSLTALFDRASGQTHLLAAPSPEILVALAAGPATAAELVARLSATFDLSADGDTASVIAARLHELAALGLVELL
jgi:PqqD family protein of HPr-rel-A system